MAATPVYLSVWHGIVQEHIVLETVAVEVVKKFIETAPDSAKETRDGQLPLHMAISNKASAEVITALGVAYPEGWKIKNGG